MKLFLFFRALYSLGAWYYVSTKELANGFKLRCKGRIVIKRKFTTVTQLHEKNNQHLIDYFESARGTYYRADRFICELHARQY